MFKQGAQSVPRIYLSPQYPTSSLKRWYKAGLCFHVIYTKLWPTRLTSFFSLLVSCILSPQLPGLSLQEWLHRWLFELLSHQIKAVFSLSSDLWHQKAFSPRELQHIGYFLQCVAKIFMRYFLIKQAMVVPEILNETACLKSLVCMSKWWSADYIFTLTKR